MMEQKGDRRAPYIIWPAREAEDTAHRTSSLLLQPFEWPGNQKTAEIMSPRTRPSCVTYLLAYAFSERATAGADYHRERGQQKSAANDARTMESRSYGVQINVLLLLVLHVICCTAVHIYTSMFSIKIKNKHQYISCVEKIKNNTAVSYNLCCTLYK